MNLVADRDTYKEADDDHGDGEKCPTVAKSRDGSKEPGEAKKDAADLVWPLRRKKKRQTGCKDERKYDGEIFHGEIWTTNELCYFRKEIPFPAGQSGSPRSRFG